MLNSAAETQTHLFENVSFAYTEQQTVLDSVTLTIPAEQYVAFISKTLESLSKERTVISVTHMLSSVVNADQIFVIDAGEVAECGTHEALLAQQGLYQQLWDKQNGAANGQAEQAEDDHIREEFVALQARYEQLAQKESSIDHLRAANTNGDQPKPKVF